MGLGYLKTMEALIAVILITFAIVQTTVNVDYSSQWDVVILQQTAEDSLSILASNGELRNAVYDLNYTGLNASLDGIMPSYISYNLKVNGVNVITNGVPNEQISVVYYLVGKTTYDPRKLELIVWYN